MKFILHSVSYSPTWKGQEGLSLTQVIDKAKELGFDGIELIAKRPHASPLDMDAGQRKKTREMLQAKGLELACIAGYQDFSRSLEYMDMPHFEKELLYLRETIRLAADLGCKIVRIYSGFIRPNIDFDIQWEWCVKNLREGARFAEDHGVFLALQNHSWITVHHLDVLDMIKEIGSKAMRVALDAPYVRNTGVPYQEAVSAVGPLLAYSTASDHLERTVSVHHAPPATFTMMGSFQVKRMLTVPVGKGAVDYTAYFKALKSIGYDAYMAYEICSPIAGGGAVASLDACARESLAALRKIHQNVYG